MSWIRWIAPIFVMLVVGLISRTLLRLITPDGGIVFQILDDFGGTAIGAWVGWLVFKLEARRYDLEPLESTEKSNSLDP